MPWASVFDALTRTDRSSNRSLPRQSQERGATRGSLGPFAIAHRGLWAFPFSCWCSLRWFEWPVWWQLGLILFGMPAGLPNKGCPPPCSGRHGIVALIKQSAFLGQPGRKRVNPLSLISPWVVALDKDRFFKKLSLMGTKGTCDQLKHQLVKVGGERNARVRTGMERWMVMTVSNIKPVMWWLRSIDRTSSQETAPDPRSSRNQQRRLIAPSTGQTPQLSSPGNRSMSGTNGRGKKI